MKPVLLAIGPLRRPLVLAGLGGLLVCSQIGCVGSENLEFRRGELSGVSYEPTFVRDPSRNQGAALPASRTYWVLEGLAADTGEEFLLRWDSFLVTYQPPDRPEETCDLCEALATNSACGPNASGRLTYQEPPEVELYGAPLRDGAMGAAAELVLDGHWSWDRSCSDRPTGSRLTKDALFRATADRAYEARFKFVTVEIPDTNTTPLRVFVVPQAGSRAMPLREVGPGAGPTLFRFPPHPQPGNPTVENDLAGALSPGEVIFDPEIRVCDVRLYAAVADATGVLAKAADAQGNVKEWRPYQVSVHERSIVSPRFLNCVGDRGVRDGIIDMTDCFHDDTGERISPAAVTPVYRTGSNQRLFWEIEYQGTDFPLPTLEAGEVLAIEFSLRSALRPEQGCQ